jgi:hypothetical protein
MQALARDGVRKTDCAGLAMSSADNDEDADDDARARLEGSGTNALAAFVNRRNASALHAIFMVSNAVLQIVPVNVNGANQRLPVDFR